MSDFLKFFDDKVNKYPMHMNIYYSKITDWGIHIWKKGCGESGKDIEILNVQDCDMELCFAKAHVELKEWFCENEGGY
jgi:hypothetical protein